MCCNAQLWRRTAVRRLGGKDMNIIEARGLTKRFKELVAVNEVNIRVERGEIYGFVGLNGAGKTTTIRMLLGMIKPTKGEVYLFGKSVRDVDWNKIGYLVETTHSYPDLTVKENLLLFYHLRKLENKKCIDEVIEKLKLYQYRNVKAKHLSLGNLQRLGIAKVLLHKPRLLILDEPMNGLDPAGIIEVREMLKELSTEGVTVFISSHILSELSKLATKIGIIHNGKLVRELTSHELEREVEKKLIIDTTDNRRAEEFFKSRGFSYRFNGDKLEVFEKNFILNPEVISEMLFSNKIIPKTIYVFEEDLETFFIRMIR